MVAAAAEETQLEEAPVEVQESPSEPHNPVLVEQASVAQLSPEQTLAGEQVSQDEPSLGGQEEVCCRLTIGHSYNLIMICRCWWRR